jgi:hypothetical protein
VSSRDRAAFKPLVQDWNSWVEWRWWSIQPLPEDVRLVDRLEQATTALVFADDAASLRDLLAAHRDQLARPGVGEAPFTGGR